MHYSKMAISEPIKLENEANVRSRRKRVGCTLFILFSAYLLGYATVEIWNRLRMSPNRSTLSSEKSELIWSDLEAYSAKELSWSKCYGGDFECAQLRVPLDYYNPSLGQAGIAIVRYPSKVPRDHPEYRGSVLFNFGGPGQSGVTLATLTAVSFQDLLGPEYDIVSFDPRGVARSTPQIRYFPNQAEGIAFRVRLEENPAFNTTADSFARYHAQMSIIGNIAYTNARDSAPYVSTTLVARDMRQMVEALGNDKLQYWGFSYGAVLGATYASMFPDNIGRLVMDGVMDPEEYSKSSWARSLLDTDKALRWFLQACVDAGPSDCALYEHTADKIHARLRQLFDNLKKTPVPVFLPEHSFPGMLYGWVTYPLTKVTLLIFLAAPYGRGHFDASWISTALRDLERGDATTLWRTLGLLTERMTCDPQTSLRSSLLDMPPPELQNAIQCGDGDEVRDTVEDLKRNFEMLAQYSEFADVFSMRGACLGAKIRPVERFTGPFVANTSFPLLLVGNSADPITPLESAHKTSKGFNGSVVLTQNSAGHTSLSATSLCTAQAIRAYFRDGTLPEPGTLCDITSRMFESQKTNALQELAKEERGVVDTWERTRQSVTVSPAGFPHLPPRVAG